MDRLHIDQLPTTISGPPSSMNRLQSIPVRYDNIQLVGGLDQVTPNLSLVPGVVRRALNFECSVLMVDILALPDMKDSMEEQDHRMQRMSH